MIITKNDDIDNDDDESANDDSEDDESDMRIMLRMQKTVITGTKM